MLENEETMENQLEGVEQSLADYEKRYVIGTSPGQEESWENIKKSLIEIIETSKSPYISRKFELPVILIATPEIVSLPQNMGNLANIIKTGDGGGLADISASLVTELDRQGVNVHVTLPEYQYLFSTQALIRHEAYEKLRIQIDDTSRIHLVTDDMFTGATQVYDDIYTGLDKIDLRKANAFQRGILSRTFKVLKRQHELRRLKTPFLG
jgi:hypothetical protein